MSVNIFTNMIGSIITNIEGGISSDEMIFTTNSNKAFRFKHYQDCCESVCIDDICGDLNDLLNSPIVEAEEVSNMDEPRKLEYCESYTWTFYRFATINGSVTVKWLGTSNGYYSERVSYDELDENGEVIY